METIEVTCPAKINLFLAITGRRSDGYHNLVSLMAPLELGDRLRLALMPNRTSETSFQCDEPSLPRDRTNLVLRAVEEFRRRHRFSGHLSIELKKRVPAGAGLGGGSSDAAGTLFALNQLLGKPLGMGELTEVAALIGSDCPFFLTGQPAVVRGRGERIEVVPETVRRRLTGKGVLLIKPSFPVLTAWAYGAMARLPENYCSPDEAESRLKAWLDGDTPPDELLFNNLETAVFRKYIPLVVLKEGLEREVGLSTLMSGSGSTLFSLEKEEEKNRRAEGLARDALGDAGWVARTHIR